MLTRNVRSAVGKSLRLFGEPTTSSASVDVAKNLEQLKHGPHLDRITKSQARECLMAASNLENPSKEIYHKLERILKKQLERNELTSRTAALTALAAYKLGLYGHAERILKRATLCPSIMRRSLSVLILSGKGELDKALDQLEAVLCEDDALFNSWNSSISEEALDILCATIKERDDTQKQVKYLSKK
ncbi:hypothetical protein WR25_07366 [Diploscapter pachys]|uniref:Uncharacterized protein n=1 Tax=Diploscapter pachys TaxID=2018661 RepID=A0A2A2KB73_9BILA|nr:hypothetical protein WR25_07366 [Diploscapter pachys]